jgi:hypothetical protein
MSKSSWNVLFIVVVLAALGVGAFFYFRPTGDQYGGTPLPSTENPGVSTDKWKTYGSADYNFSIKYPPDFAVDATYKYTERGPGKDIPGVSFTIPESLRTGTNLSADTKISVEVLANKANCKATDFIDGAQTTETVTEGGVTYSVAKGGGAAAGNRYEEIVYAMPNCQAIRYFIHSTNSANYDPGTVKEFDRAGLLELFDDIRRSYQFYSKG